MSASPLPPTGFAQRHIGIAPDDLRRMLDDLGRASLGALVDEAVPADIRSTAPLDLPPARSEAELLADLRALAAKNTVLRQCIGQGFSDT
ncbi:MAG: hypothetical protein GXX90_04675, partial [Microbacteriaceae bacterium]|nr:hypothetical protein [Microbacteriaceae bacterium]